MTLKKKRILKAYMRGVGVVPHVTVSMTLKKKRILKVVELVVSD